MQKNYALVIATSLCCLAISAATYYSSAAFTPDVQQARSIATSSGQPLPQTACSIIDDLDDCIQERFNSMDEFGPARVFRFPNNRHFTNFDPSTKSERETVARLQTEGWEVLLYLAGAESLKASFTKPKSEPQIQSFDGLSGPAFVTPLKLVSRTQYHPAYELTWPAGPARTLNQLTIPHSNNPELRDHAHRAFSAFAKEDRYDFTLNGLSFTARPVRAQASCLACHSGNDNPEKTKSSTVKSGSKHAPSLLKVGDALGAAIYAYTKINQK